MEVHPLAELIPPMTEEEYRELREDIESSGYREDEPLILFEGKILDGRHRHRVCRELQIEPPTQEFNGDDPTAYVISKNLHRRHLTRSQIAMTAAEALPHLEEEARKRQAHGATAPGRHLERSGPTGPERSDTDPKRARAEAAELTGAAERSVGRAKRVREADPELANQVKAGEVALTAAEEKITGRPNKDRSNGLTDAAGQQPVKTFDVSSERNRQVAEKAAERVHGAVGSLRGTTRALLEVKVERVLAIAPADDLTYFDSELRKITSDINKFRKRIREGAR